MHNGKYDWQKNIFMLLSIIFLTMLAIYVFLLFNYRPLMGDDFSFYFSKDVSGYVNPELALQLEYQPKTDLSVSQHLQIFENKYMQFSGRVIAAFFSMCFTIINNRTVFAVLGSIIYVSITILAGRLVFHTIRETIQHPFVLIMMGSFLWIYNEGVGNLYMFTMLFHYGLSYFLWLLVINFAMDRIWQEENVTKHSHIKLILMNILGIFAGLSHELIGACSLFLIAFMTLCAKGFAKGIREIKYYMGAAAGYLVCFFAPGNFNRAATQHDATIHNPYSQKLLLSIKQHVATLLKMEEAGTWIFLTALILFAGMLIYKCRNKLPISWKKAVCWQICVLASVLLWAAVSYVPKYGVLLAMIMEMVAWLRILYDPQTEDSKSAAGIRKSRNIAKCILAGLFLVVIGYNISWVPEMIRETQDRFALVRQAAEAGQEEVTVPSYSEEVYSHSVMIPNNLNNSSYYQAKEVTKLFYGTQILIEQPDEL